MKKALLFLASMLVGATAFAQSFTAEWPRPAAPEFTQITPEDTCYLWNVEAGGFYTNYRGDAPSYPGPYYGTRASVCDTVGAKVVFTQTNPDTSKDESTNFADEPNAYLLVSYVTKFNEFRCTFFAGWNGIWTDNNSEANRYWKIVPNGNYFKILPEAELNSTSTSATAYLGLRETDADKVVFLYDTETEGAIGAEEGFYSDWAAVSKEAYNTYYTYINSAEAQEMIALANAAATLKANILSAQEKGVTAAELADYYAVYNNTNSTLDELNMAAAAAYDKGRWLEIKEYFENIEQGEKNDVSGVFVNPDLETGDTNGWDITYTANSEGAKNVGFQDNKTYKGTYQDENGETVEFTISKFIEAWKDNVAPNWLADGSITQTIPALPAGKYMLAVDVVAYYQWGGSKPDDVQLFAKASLDGKEYSIPMATGDGIPEHYEFTFVHTGGSMTLGLRVLNSAEAQHPANWIAMDNLKLYYYGEVTEDPDKILLDAAIEKAIKEYDPENLEEIYAYTGDKAAYVTAVESAQQISEEGGDYVAAKEALLLASDTLKLSIAAYETFDALRTEAIERTEEFDGTKFEGINDALGDMLMDWDEAYEKCTYTMEQIAALPDLLTKAINDYVSDNLEAGDNITFMIKNPNFDKNFEGWETTGAGVAWGGTDRNNTLGDDDAVLASGNAERWHDTFTMSQTVYNMPAGLYQFTCQGFTRCDEGSKNEGALYAIVNGEEQSSLLPLLSTYPTATSMYDPGDWPRDSQIDGGFVPNSMTGANYHFNHTTEGNDFPDYTTTLNITLSETADVTVGVKCTSKLNWVIFDNFQLVYLGSGSDAYMIAINQKLAELKKYIDDNEENIGTDVKDLYDTLLGQSTKLSEDECTAFLGTLDEAIAYAKSSVEVYAKADEAMSNLATAVDESDNESAKAAASTFDTTYADAIANRELTVEEVNTAITTINELIAALNVPGDYNTATDDAPIDMTKCILNADIEQGGNVAWTFTLAKGNGPTKDSGIHTKSMEAWSGTTGAELDFNFFQTLTSLPAGKYKLSANAANSLNGVSEDVTAYNNNTASTGRAVLYIETSSGTKASTPVSVQEGDATSTYSNYSVIFTLAEGESVNVGVRSVGTMAARWFVADDFELTYYGTESAKTDTDGGPLTGVEEIGVKKVVNGKFFEKGRIFIMRNGVKYNVAGQIIE